MQRPLSLTRALLLTAQLSLMTLSGAACSSGAGEPDLRVTQVRHPVARGAVRENMRDSVLMNTVETYCMAKIAQNSKLERDRLTKGLARLGYTLLDEQTPEVWLLIFHEHAVVMHAHDKYRLSARIDYRCSLPAMKIGSPDDVSLNGGATGSNGTLWEVVVGSGSAKGRHAILNPGLYRELPNTEKGL